jgi:hypothetical protein
MSQTLCFALIGESFGLIALADVLALPVELVGHGGYLPSAGLPFFLRAARALLDAYASRAMCARNAASARCARTAGSSLLSGSTCFSNLSRKPASAGAVAAVRSSSRDQRVSDASEARVFRCTLRAGRLEQRLEGDRYGRLDES